MKSLKLFKEFTGSDTLKSFTGSRIINEFLTNELIKFNEYLKSSKASKKNPLPYKYSHLFNDFVLDTGYKFEGPREAGENKIISWLEKNDKKTYDKFAEYLYDKIEKETLPIRPNKYPSWRWFKSPEILKNQWLIHFSNAAKEISKSGFKLGAKNIDDLACTRGLPASDKVEGGYNFGFTIDDFPKHYLYPTAYGYQHRYGNYAVLFRASGIRVWHEKDKEHQVIFNGRDAKDIILIEFKNDPFRYIICGKNGKILFGNPDLNIVVRWAINNYGQYHKIIKA
jgi:hypothetical protein